MARIQHFAVYTSRIAVFLVHMNISRQALFFLQLINLDGSFSTTLDAEPAARNSEAFLIVLPESIQHCTPKFVLGTRCRAVNYNMSTWRLGGWHAVSKLSHELLRMAGFSVPGTHLISVYQCFKVHAEVQSSCRLSSHYIRVRERPIH
ncbi:hypothetical protein K438DRAFT_399442 [Mycena galopus ATCC 62051]|nr:hypothetical protein K438DRAFT_399442 [Mycena galopus ATCC 62051]